MGTTTNKLTPQIQDDEISLKEVALKLKEWFYYLLSKWKIIALAAIFGGIFGFIYAFFKKPIYTAECTFVLEEQGSGGGLGQYAGIASVVGIDLGSVSNNGIFQGDNIMELYKSRSMITKTLLSIGDFDGKKELLINRYIEFNKLRKNWSKKTELANLSFDLPANHYKLQHDSIIGEIVKNINRNYLAVSKPDKKLSIISVQVKSKDECFAKQFTDRIVENVNDFYVQTKTKKAFENLQILQRQADSVRRVLNYSIGGAAEAVDANPNANPAMQFLKVPSQRRQVDVQASSAIYAELMKNLEIARISLRKETPLIQIVDKPILPLEKNKIGRLMGFLIGAIVFMFCCLVIFIGKKSIEIITR